MNFEELGLTLQREREKQGLSVEGVMEATKISRTNIVGLEAGDRSAMPHPVYTKGFVKSYARYLGLDADELCMVIDREFQDEVENEEQAYEVSPAAERAFQEHHDGGDIGKQKPVWPLMLLLIVLIGGVVAFAVSFMGKDDTKGAESVAPTVEKVEKASEPLQAPKIVEEATVAAEQEASKVEAAAKEQADKEQADKEQADKELAEAKAAEAAAKAKAKAEQAAKLEEKAKADAEKAAAESAKKKQKYDHVVIIRATTEKGCWIGLWKGNDTNMARDFVLKQGEPLRLMFNNPRRIRIGNASGVTVLYNGKAYPLNEAKGNIQTLRFGME